MGELAKLQAAEAQLAVDEKFKNVGVDRTGDKIILPEGMSFDAAMRWLERRKVEDERVVAVREIIECFPLDGCHALMRALEKKYGWAQAVPTPGFWGDKPPTMIGIEVAPGVTKQVVWGRMQVPAIDGWLGTSAAFIQGRWVFSLVGEVKNKNKADVTEIARLTREYLQTGSVYRGKAIRVSLESNPESFDPNDKAPRFIDTTTVRPEELIFPDDVAIQVKDNLFTPIEKTEQCRQYGIPLKRGVLFEGPYGTGKTLAANVTALKCVENGWTFIYVDHVGQLQQAIRFAQQYQPAVIFAEDIDRAVEGEKRTADIDAILNTIDGVDTKGTEMVVVLTTNHIEKINRAMLRPGRLDAVVSVRPPDAAAAERLLRLYGRGLIPTTETLDTVSQRLHGQIPAVLREVVERAKLAALGRQQTARTLELHEEDLLHAAAGMLAQVQLVQAKETTKPTPVEQLGTAVGQALAHTLKKNGIQAES